MVLMLRTPILIAKIEMICLSAKMSYVITVCVGSLIQMQIPIIVVVVFLTIQIVAFILVVGILLIELGCYLHIFLIEQYASRDIIHDLPNSHKILQGN